MWGDVAPRCFLGSSPYPPPQPEDEDSDRQEEESVWGWEEGHISQPKLAPRTGMGIDTPPWTQPGTPVQPRSPPPTPPGDIEICTLVQASKRPRLPTPGSRIPWSNVKPSGANGMGQTPVTCGRFTTPHQVGPMRTTFRTPHPNSPASAINVVTTPSHWVTDLNVRVDAATRKPPEVDLTWLLRRPYSFLPPVTYREQCQLSPTALSGW